MDNRLRAVPWPRGEVVIAVDDTIERRWGAKIKARRIYRDPVRSSLGQFVSWLSLAVMSPVPFAVRRCRSRPCWRHRRAGARRRANATRP
jgi:hypothetical protein